MSLAELQISNIQRTLEDGGKTLRVRIPIQLKKRGGRKEIIMAGGAPTKQLNMPLVIAIARAHRWAKALETGKVDSAVTIAGAVGVDPAYVNRFLRLTLLAPDIIEDILNGREPSGVSLAKLIKETPAVWEEQREKFGFAGHDVSENF